MISTKSEEIRRGFRRKWPAMARGAGSESCRARFPEEKDTRKKKRGERKRKSS